MKKSNRGRKVYELLDPFDLIVGNAGPSEFLWLFEHASLVLTDSFHACVFSFIFNKPFLVFDRNTSIQMNSRIETFLPMFGLERKRFIPESPIDIWEHDYEVGYKRLEAEQEKARAFLKNALKSEVR